MRDYRAAIGLIVSAWSLLELEIESTTWWLAGLHPDLGICITSQLQSARSKLIAVEGLTLLRTGSQKLAKDVRIFMNDLEGPTRKRNRIVHDPLSFKKGGDVFFVRIRLDREVHRKVEKAELADLRAFFDEIGVLLERFVSMREAILQIAAVASPQIPPPPPVPIPRRRRRGVQIP